MMPGSGVEREWRGWEERDKCCWVRAVLPYSLFFQLYSSVTQKK